MKLILLHITTFLIYPFLGITPVFADVEFKFDNVTVNLNHIPSSGGKAHEGQLCEGPDGGIEQNAEIECHQDDPNDRNINPHTWKFYENVNNNYATRHSCFRVTGPDPFVRACIMTVDSSTTGLTATSCFADWECCSHYCHLDSPRSFDPFNNVPLPQGLRGKCMPMPPGYVSKYPFQPDGKSGGESCTTATDCQSNICDSGKCKTASVCTRCTEVGNTPTYGAPCCGESAFSESEQVCFAIDTRFEPVALLDIFSGSNTTLGTEATATNTLQGLNLISPSTPERGVCKVTYSIAGSTNSNSQEIEQVINHEINIRDSLLMSMAFLQLWKASTTPLAPDDVFGIHAQLKKAMKAYVQAKYDTFSRLKKFEAESFIKMAELQKAKSDSQSDILNFTPETYQFRKEIAVTMRDAIGQAIIELMDNYNKKDKDKDGQAVGTMYNLGMLLARNRSAGMLQCPINYGNSFSEEAKNIGQCKYAFVNQEETDEGIDNEEAEENDEESNYQEGMIYRASTGCGRTENMEEYVEDKEEYEEEDDGEHGEFEYEHMSRFCVGRDSQAGVYVENAGKRDTWLNRILGEAGASLLDGNPTISLVTTYPAFTHGNDGTRTAGGDSSVATLKANMNLFLANQVRHLDGIITHGGNFSVNTAPYVGVPEVDQTLLTRATASAAKAADPMSNFLDDNLAAIMGEFTKSDYAVLDALVYYTSASTTYMQPAKHRANFILLLSLLLRDLYSFYDKAATAYESVAICFAQVANEIDKELEVGGGTAMGGGATGMGNADNSTLAPTTNTGNAGPDVAGGGIDPTAYSSNGAIGLGGTSGSVSGGGITSNNGSVRNADILKGIFATQDAILAGAKRRKGLFDKAFKGSLLAKKAQDDLNSINSGLNGMVNGASRATSLIYGTKGSIPAGAAAAGSLNADSGSTNAAGTPTAVDLLTASDDKSKTGYAGRSGDKMNMGDYAGREGNPGGGGGTPDVHNLIENAKNEKEKLVNKFGDSIWKIISNRYMSSLDRILEKKKP